MTYGKYSDLLLYVDTFERWIEQILVLVDRGRVVDCAGRKAGFSEVTNIERRYQPASFIPTTILHSL